MAIINVETKFDIGDSVYRLTDGEIHNLIIRGFEINVDRYAGVTSTVETINIEYTATDSKSNQLCRVGDEDLFTEKELKEYINNYFERK